MISAQQFASFDPSTDLSGFMRDKNPTYTYDFSWLGGSYQIFGPDLKRGDGVTQYFGKKTGADQLVILDLRCSEDVFVQRDQEWETVLSTSAKDQATDVLAALGLPPFFCVDTAGCENMLAEYFPGAQMRNFRTPVGLSFVLAGIEGLTIDVQLMQFEEWSKAQVAGVTLYHEKAVMENCAVQKDAPEAVNMIQNPDEYFESFEGM